MVSSPLNLSVRTGDILTSPVLPLCGIMLITGGSPNVMIAKKPAMSLGDSVIPSSPVIPYVLPLTQLPIVAQYAATSGMVTSTAVVVDPISSTFQWPLVTTPAPFPSSGSKTVFINKKPAMRVCDQILPLTFQFIATQPNVFIGG